MKKPSSTPYAAEFVLARRGEGRPYHYTKKDGKYLCGCTQRQTEDYITIVDMFLSELRSVMLLPEDAKARVHELRST